MLDELTYLLFRHHEGCRATGAALYSNAGFAVIAGLYVKVGTLGASFVAAATGHPAMRAADLFPSVWTWWIPESPAGFAFYGVLAAAGALLAVTAKKVQKQLRSL